MIKRLFSPPQFENEDDNFRAKFINGFAWVSVLSLTIAMIAFLAQDAQDLTVAVLSGLILVMLSAVYLLHRGKIFTSGLVIVILGWLGLGFQAYTADGVKDSIIMGFIALGLFASIVAGWRAGGVVILFGIGALWALAFLEARGFLIARIQNPFDYARDLSLVFLVLSTLIYFSTTSLRDAIDRASTSEKQVRASNQELVELNQTLEERVSNRTTELEIANQRNQRRAKQFEAIAQVAHATAASQELQTLLSRLVDVISEQFGFYHTGIFLLDDNREHAVLTAANSEGGKRMLQRGHKLRAGQTGIVGVVSATGAPRIALDVGTDAAFFDNPDLPNTRSEIALPLRTANEVIGVLDVQSTEANAFQPEDIEVLSTLADQVTIALQNARSFETTQKLLEQAQKTSGTYLYESWRTIQSKATRVGYLISGNTLKPLNKPVTSTQINRAIISREIIAESGKNATLAVPIRLRDEVIGIMNIRMPVKHDWDPDEIDIVEAVANRLSLAIETSLLIETTQRRAEIERVTSEISGKISSTTQFESILRTAAEELSRVLGGSEVLVQIQPESLEKSVVSTVALLR